ncbi:MAG TPA: hypothetical protein VGJ80_00015 [Gemmatimonadales bacterium]
MTGGVMLALRCSRLWILLSIVAFGCDRVTPLDPVAEFRASSSSGSTLAAPSSASAVAASHNQIDISWRDNSTDETGFEIHRSVAGATFALLVSTAASVTSHSDGEVSAETQYCYKVRAFRTTGKKTSYSAFAEAACATTPAPPQLGSINVTTTTSGDYPDPDGYYIRLDDLAERSVRSNDSITFSDVPGGEHTLLVWHVAWNCSLAGPNPRSVTVNGGVTNVAVSVTCVPGNSIQVTAVTTGVDVDPDGYTVDLWRNWGWSRVYAGSATVPTNGTVTIYALPPEEYDVEFSGWTANCSPLGPNPRRVDLSNGGSAAVEFDITCAATSQIAFVDVADGNAEIYVIKANGTGRTRLTMHPAEDLEPAWSPDGSKIAFVSNRDGNGEIYMMQADGSNPVRLTDHPASDGSPSWSPDGTRIAFVSDRDGYNQIYVMGSDGSAVTATNQAGTDPAWSPDGQRIAFAAGAIFVMNSDGTGLSQVTTPVFPDAQPAWSPDGQWLAFARTQTESGTNIWAVGADGSGEWQMSFGGCGCELAGNPSWSPDGAFRAAFSGYGYGFFDVDRVFFTGGLLGAEFLTTGFDPSWHR